MATYDDICCDNRAKYPIEHLFKSIYMLQKVAECEEEVAMLTKKLESYFDVIPESKGTKKFNQCIYYPNGLCEWNNKGIKWQILLKEWDNKEEAKSKITNSLKRDYKIIEEYCRFWYYQVKEYLKKPYKTIEQLDLVSYNNKNKARELMTDEEKALLGNLAFNFVTDKTIGRELANVFYINVRDKNQNDSAHQKQGIRFAGVLNEEDIKELLTIVDYHAEICKDARSWEIRSRFFELMNTFTRKKALENNLLPVGYKDPGYKKFLEENKNNNYYYCYNRYYDIGSDLLEVLYPKLLRVTDPTAIKVMKKLGLVAKDHEPIVDEEEIEIQDTAETTEVIEEESNIIEVEYVVS